MNTIVKQAATALKLLFDDADALFFCDMLTPGTSRWLLRGQDNFIRVSVGQDVTITRRGREIRHFVQPFRDSNQRRAHCAVTLFTPTDDATSLVCMLHEQADNAGMSVTNAAEQIASLLLSSELNTVEPTSVVWIEHYPSDQIRDNDQYSLLTFAKMQRHETMVQVVGPQWSWLDAVGVETLTGFRPALGCDSAES